MISPPPAPSLSRSWPAGPISARRSAWATAELTNVLRIAGDLTAAEARAKETLEIGERIQVAVLVGLANEQLARLALARDEPGQAEDLLHQALAAYLEYGAARYLPQHLRRAGRDRRSPRQRRGGRAHPRSRATTAGGARSGALAPRRAIDR